MKIYQVVKRGARWYVLIPDASPGVHPSGDKSSMVAWACDAAQKVDGEVQVRDGGGRLEAVYAYVNGVQHRKP